MTPAPGIYRGIPAEEYHSWEAASSHRIALLDRSPAHARFEIDSPHETTPAKLLGSLAHTLILEPEKLDAEWAVSPNVDARTKEGKAIRAQFEATLNGRRAISEETLLTAQRMAHKVLTHSRASSILAAKQDIELSIVWEWDGVLCKMRTDFLAPSMGICGDLKSCRNAERDTFQSDAFKYGYHKQAAFYSAGLAANGISVDHFIFIAAENEAPHHCAVYEMDHSALEVGLAAARAGVELWGKCVRENHWPAYPEQIQTIGLPDWVARRMMKELNPW